MKISYTISFASEEDTSITRIVIALLFQNMFYIAIAGKIIQPVLRIDHSDITTNNLRQI